jgi:hypothetical protein
MRILLLVLLLSGCSVQSDPDVELAWDYGGAQLYTSDGFYFFEINGQFSGGELVYADKDCFEPIVPYFEQDFVGNYIIKIDGQTMYYTTGEKIWRPFHYILVNGYCDYQQSPMLGHKEYYIVKETWRRDFI